jgi:hypothetical protein
VVEIARLKRLKKIKYQVCPAIMAEIILQIETPEGGAERTAQLANLLRDQIKALPIESVHIPRITTPPEGTRAGEAFSWSTLVVSLAPAGIKELLQLIQAVVTRQKASAEVTVKYQGSELTIKGRPDPQQLQAIKDFLDCINSKRSP